MHGKYLPALGLEFNNLTSLFYLKYLGTNGRRNFQYKKKLGELIEFPGRAGMY